MISKLKHGLILALIFLVSGLFSIGTVFAQGQKNYNAQDLLAKSEIFITPRNGSFLVGSTFESQIYINTKGNSLNAINLKVKYDSSKLSLVNPSGGKSIFGIWVEPPYYDNKNGSAGMSGIVTDGITTSSGLIVTMTFKVLSAGPTTVSITDQTSANLNDGYGSEVLLTRGRAEYVLNNRPPEGVYIYSETHPSGDTWYNNNSPIFGWDVKQPTEGFSILFDTLLQSNPDPVIIKKDQVMNYTNISDGIWYLHVRPVSNGVWGSTSSFVTRIDTRPPAKFKPIVSKIKDSNGSEKYLVAFFTTDSLSGLDHYEVGLISKDDIDKTSPLFTQTESPYVVNIESGTNSRVIIRAYDKAGNVVEEFVDIYPGVVLMQRLKKIGIYLLFIIILLLLLELILHYLFGHHIIDRVKQGYRVAKGIRFNDKPVDTLTSIEKNYPTPVARKTILDTLIKKPEPVITETPIVNVEPEILVVKAPEPIIIQPQPVVPNFVAQPEPTVEIVTKLPKPTIPEIVMPEPVIVAKPVEPVLVSEIKSEPKIEQATFPEPTPIKPEIKPEIGFINMSEFINKAKDIKTGDENINNT